MASGLVSSRGSSTRCSGPPPLSLLWFPNSLGGRAQFIPFITFSGCCFVNGRYRLTLHRHSPSRSYQGHMLQDRRRLGLAFEPTDPPSGPAGLTMAAAAQTGRARSLRVLVYGINYAPDR